MAGGNFVTLGAIPDREAGQVQQTNFFQSGLGANGVVGNTVIPAVAGKRIFVHALQFSGFSGFAIAQFNEVTTAGATVTTQLTTTTANDNAVGVIPWTQYPWMTCAAGNALLVCNQNGNTCGFVATVLYVQG